jgi:8-oxo-dGTP pyrophosphatase MutT (NUDIX family)
VSGEVLASEGIPAATLIVFRRGAASDAPELLMVVRSRALAFAGGAAVFPGGRVDEADFRLAAQLDHDLADIDEAAHRIAAIRETLEETGLAVGLNGTVDSVSAAEGRALLIKEGALAPVLERFRWSIDWDALVPFTRWLPRGMKHERIFDARFYLADLGTGAVDVAVDATENTRLFWTTAQGALKLAERGEIDIIFPTRRNLERLATFPDFASARVQAEAIGAKMISPVVVEQNGARWLTIPEGLGYPVTRERLDSAMRG